MSSTASEHADPSWVASAPVPDDVTQLRLALFDAGHVPLPVCAPGCTHIDRDGKRCESRGKAVHIAGWSTLNDGHRGSGITCVATPTC